MTPNLKLLAGALLWSALLTAGPARAADVNVIRAIDVQERDGALELSVQGSRPPSYSVFKLQDPQRLVLDLAGADVSGLTAPGPVGKGGVLSIATAQYQDQRTAVGRVIVALEGPRKYEVVPRGDAVVVRVLAADAAVPAAPEAAKAAPATAPAAAVEAAASPAPPDAATAPAPADDHVVSRRVDEARVARAARAVTAVRQKDGRIHLATDGDVARIEILELRDPARLVLDLQGVSKAPRGTVPLDGTFSQVRFGQAGGKTRVVLDAAGALPALEVKRVKGGLVIEPAALAAAQPAAEPAAPAAGAAQATAAPVQAVAPDTRARISAVRFSGSGAGAKIEVKGKASYSITRPDPRTVVLTFEGAQLPRSLERSLDTSAFQGPVHMVSSFNQPTTGQVRIVASLRAPAADRIVERPDGLVWTFGPQAAAAAEPSVRIEASGSEAAGFASAGPGYAVAGAPQARGYTGKVVTFDFHDIDIRNLLRVIADISKKNIIVSDDVKGKVTVSLRNIPWDQALDLILQVKGLDKDVNGNVYRIAKMEDIQRERLAKAEAEKARIPLIPTKVRIISVNFARAGDLAARIKDVLSERGTVSVDERTNVIIVKDIPEKLVAAEGLVRNLDLETPQVLIEARIVEASSNFNRALGVQWGGNAAMNQANGNPTGLIFPYNTTATGAAGGGPTTGTSATPNYAVNLPAAIGQGSGGGLGFTFGTIGGAFNLNLRLSALENSGTVKTISAPKITTIDNKEATIGQGISIPFSQTSASGVNTTFIEAKLELRVTPHVTADGNVVLKIKATNNAPNPQLTGANGQPSISKREADTEVLVKDGDTTVIGGIYTRATSNRRSNVPWLGRIPVLGYFFRTTTNQDDHTELLIFITPRILNPRASAVANGN
ncbi:MAG TPA: type IV pilus secretin PilQ [Anaeromyxobacter sp.]|nr:type IV pilus secretin PilQ [Anaeromyxobacter sp.]